MAAKQADKDPKPQTAQNHLSEMLAQGLITAKEADWHTGDAAAQKQTQTRKPPFSLTEVETGLTGGITTKRMATLVSTYGVDFTLTASARKRLTSDGADDNLLAAIAPRSARPTPKIERYSEKGNERKGKFTESEAEAVFNSLPRYMADVARFPFGHYARAA